MRVSPLNSCIHYIVDECLALFLTLHVHIHVICYIEEMMGKLHMLHVSAKQEALNMFKWLFSSIFLLSGILAVFYDRAQCLPNDILRSKTQ